LKVQGLQYKWVGKDIRRRGKTIQDEGSSPLEVKKFAEERLDSVG
jgi:hypothetical protein